MSKSEYTSSQFRVIVFSHYFTFIDGQDSTEAITGILKQLGVSFQLIELTQDSALQEIERALPLAPILVLTYHNLSEQLVGIVDSLKGIIEIDFPESHIICNGDTTNLSLPRDVSSRSFFLGNNQLPSGKTSGIINK